MKTVIRKRLNFRGDVQGVGFRYRAEHAARLVGATGWVRNDPDGGVTMELQGEERQIDDVVAMIARGAYVEIRAMTTKSLPVQPDERGFRVLDDDE